MSNIRYIRPFFTLFATVFTLLFSHNAFAQENVAQGVKVVVLDAGHGGCYPGARYEGINEKDINLQVVLKVGALINKHMPEIKVVYTRTTDKMFSNSLGADLQARADIAHRNNGDLFVSVHSNAYPPSSNVRGTVTLIMGESSSEISRNENALYANNKEELLDMSDAKTAAIVRAYIQNLQFSYGEYSEMMARLIQEEYAKFGMKNRGVRPQPLKVLYATDMPSVLTEIGFMTNHEDLVYITSEKGQNEISQAIFNGIKRYIEAVRRSLLVDSPQKEKHREKKEKEKQVASSTQTKQTTTSTAKSATTTTTTAAKPSASAVKSTTSTASTSTTTTASTSTTSTASTATKLYTIQFMAGANKVAIEQLQLNGLKGKVWILEGTGAAKYKYCYGEYKDRTSAQAALSEVQKSFPQAFVISYSK